MQPQAVAEAYFAAVRAKDIDALAALYAENARFTLPNGKMFEGKAAIREMHAGVAAAGSPFPTPVEMVVGDGAVAARIEAQLPDGTVRRTANVYRLDAAGKIAEVNVYAQG